VETWYNVARKRVASSSGAVNILNAITLRRNYPSLRTQPKKPIKENLV